MNLLIRADANTKIGSGHVMRCLALGQACQDDGGKVTYVMALGPSALEERLRSEGMEVLRLSESPGSVGDALRTSQLARDKKVSWVVVDGYHFGSDYQRLLKEEGHRLLFIDDNGLADRCWADFVLNQNCYAHEGLYTSKESNTQLCLGSPYVLLRREFLPWQGWQREIPEVARKVLITLGGGDPENVTPKVINALKGVKISGLETVVIVGGSNPRYDELRQAMLDSPHAMRLERNVADMPQLMAWADTAVSGGGSTCWELAFMGVPMVAVIIAENQEPIAKSLAGAEVSLNAGWHHSLSEDSLAAMLTGLLEDSKTRGQMSRRGREMIDGAGTQRLLGLLKSRPSR